MRVVCVYYMDDSVITHHPPLTHPAAHIEQTGPVTIYEQDWRFYLHFSGKHPTNGAICVISVLKIFLIYFILTAKMSSTCEKAV